MTRKFAEFEAVAQLDLTVPVGTCLGLLGPNGAGKTTTIEMLVGLNRPDAGTIQILGKTYDEEATAIREQIGVQLQETHLPEKNTVFELLRLFRSFYPSGRELDEVVELIGLEEKRNARVESLSGGQRQRLSLGCALVHEPEVLFLDEPTTGLDPKARRTVWEVVRSFKEGGGTVLLTTHYMDEAEQLADQLVILDHGRILEQGAPARIVEQLGSDSIIEFSLQDGPRGDSQTLGVGDLLGLPGVLRAELRGASWSLSVRDVSQTLPPLFRLLESRGLVVGQVNNHRPTLDDVFVSLTGRHLQDGEGSGSPGAGADETAAPDS